jgi:hypothetical protein
VSEIIKNIERFWSIETDFIKISSWPWSPPELYHHVQQFYSTILSHTAKCCGPYILIWNVSCISHNISHPPCCQLAQLVTLCSPPFNVKLSVWLPSSCNAAPLITKATTQHKEVAVRQPITQYQILCCYPVSRPGLLDVQRLGELVRGDRKMVVAMSNWSLIFVMTGGIIRSAVYCKFTRNLFCLSYWR